MTSKIITGCSWKCFFIIASFTAPLIQGNNMAVSENRCTPNSSILIGFSIINHPFWGTTIYGNTHMVKHSHNSRLGTTFSTPGVITLESGLQYKVLREGHGHSVKQQLLTAWEAYMVDLSTFTIQINQTNVSKHTIHGCYGSVCWLYWCCIVLMLVVGPCLHTIPCRDEMWLMFDARSVCSAYLFQHDANPF